MSKYNKYNVLLITVHEIFKRNHLNIPFSIFYMSVHIQMHWITSGFKVALSNLCLDYYIISQEATD